MTLPAHRFRDREERKKNDGQHVWTFDYDGTITGAPDQLARVAAGLKALGDHIVVLTGNDSPRADLVKQLNDYGFPFDDLVQYKDDGTDGISREEHLKQFGAWGAFDNRVDRAFILAKACPHFYFIGKPTPDDRDAVKANKTKKAAKKAAKKIGLRAELRGAANPPPNLRASDDTEVEQPEHECGTCLMYHVDANGQGRCWGYGLGDEQFPTFGEWVCDSWALDPDWQAQDAAQDAADGTRSVIDIAIERAIQDERRRWQR